MGSAAGDMAAAAGGVSGGKKANPVVGVVRFIGIGGDDVEIAWWLVEVGGVGVVQEVAPDGCAPVAGDV